MPVGAVLEEEGDRVDVAPRGQERGHVAHHAHRERVEVEAIALQGQKTAVAKVADFQFLVAWGQTEILISAEKTALTKAIALANLGLLIQTEVRQTAPHMMKGSSIATS